MSAADIDLRLGKGAALWQRLAQTDFGAVLRGTAQVLAIRVAGAGLAYASMIFLARFLGTFEFGIYAYIWAWAIMLGMALPLGFNASALRFLPDYLARAKWNRMSGFLRQSYAICFLTGIIGALVGGVLILGLRDFVEPHYFVPLLIGLLCLPLITLLNQLEATARAFGWVNLAYAPSYVVRPFLIIAAIGLMWLAGYQPTAVIALWVATVSCFIGIMMQAVPLYFWLRKKLPAVRPTFHARTWTMISLSFALIEGFRMILENADVVIVGRLLDPQSVAVYFATIRTSGLIGFIYFAVASLAVPQFAKIHSVETRADLQRFVAKVIRLMFWPSLAAALILAACGPFALSLFGPDFEAGYTVLLISLFGLVLRSATGPVDYLLTLTGHHKHTIYAYGIGAAANIGLNFLLIPHYGLVGASVATYATYAGVNLYLYLMAKKHIGISAFVFARAPK